MRLAQSSANLAGHTPRKAIPMEEIALHASEDDAWTVLDKKVGLSSRLSSIDSVAGV